MDIKKTLQQISRSHWYWLAYIVGGLSSLVIALFYQYFLDELPCVVCIQIRLWFSLMIIFAISGLLLRKKTWLNFTMQFGLVLCSVGLLERSYLLLGTEKGFIFGDCGFDLGLPGWFAIEQWLPGIYQIETACGYTPEILFGVTMAESLILMSAFLVIVSAGVAVFSLTGNRQ